MTAIILALVAIAIAGSVLVVRHRRNKDSQWMENVRQLNADEDDPFEYVVAVENSTVEDRVRQFGG